MSKKSKKTKTKEDIEEQEVIDTPVEKEVTIEDLQTRIVELEGAQLRARADFENFRKRSQRDIADTRVFSKISTVTELLPIVDTFKMAMQAANADNADLAMLLVGLNMVENQFSQAFSSLGVDEISAIGSVFNPNFHEAVSEQFSEDVEEGLIISQHRCGFKIGEKLLRAATVVVSKGPEVEESPEEVVEE
jgi:molecular chaperone GrpE